MLGDGVEKRLSSNVNVSLKIATYIPIHQIGIPSTYIVKHKRLDYSVS